MCPAQVHAEAHLPSLDFCNGVEVPAEDTTGEPHTFKFRYWINNSSRMYLLEGTQKIQNKYSIKIGDVLTFSRGADKKLLVSCWSDLAASSANGRLLLPSETIAGLFVGGQGGFLSSHTKGILPCAPKPVLAMLSAVLTQHALDLKLQPCSKSMGGDAVA